LNFTDGNNVTAKKSDGCIQGWVDIGCVNNTNDDDDNLGLADDDGSDDVGFGDDDDDDDDGAFDDDDDDDGAFDDDDDALDDDDDDGAFDDDDDDDALDDDDDGVDDFIPILNTTFYVYTTRKPWNECKSIADNMGYSFASIRNQTENDAVVDYLKGISITKFWLGGYQTSFEDEPAGNWAWLDGTPWTDSTYTNWHLGQPNDDSRFSDQNHLYLWDGKWWDGKIYWKYPCLFRDSK